MLTRNQTIQLKRICEELDRRGQWCSRFKIQMSAAYPIEMHERIDAARYLKHIEKAAKQEADNVGR